jgi:CRP-like cAMP-binding protein
MLQTTNKMNYDLLARCPVFDGIDKTTAKKLLSKIHFRIKKFVPDEIVVFSGEKVSNLLIILSGSVRGEMIDYSGKTIKIEDIEAPKPLATAFLFGKENKYPVTVTANTHVQILLIPVNEFLKLLQLEKRLLVNYLNSMSTRAQFLSEKINFLSFKTIKEKAAHFLLKNTGDKLHSFELKNSQQQLAQLFGIARPSLARVLGELKKEGFIKIEKRTVTILNKEGLHKIIANG